MALIVRWRYSCICVFFLVFLGQAAALFYPDDAYKYDVEQGGGEYQPVIVRLTKRNVLGSEPQPLPVETATPAQTLNVGHPDQEVFKDPHLLSNNTAKTGGPYLTANSSAVPEEDASQPNATSPGFKGSKWLEGVRDLNKTVKDLESEVVARFPTVATETDNNNNETAAAKPDGKAPKKAENVTKPPRSDPTKPSTKRPPTTAGEELDEKAVVVPAGRTEATPPSPSTTAHAEQDVQISFPQDLSNRTLQQNNITNFEEDHHQYYNSSFVVNNADFGHAYWVDMTNRSDVHVNELLSQSHRRAATVKLKFDFPFYGHLVRNVTIATGGFLYTGDYVHSWLAATQYIAPLMANFDTSLSNHSFVKYVDNGTAFTVQWEKVVLQDRPDSGDFTFQATLHSNGDIVFVYQSVPVVIESIQDDHHPVKVGLSDAYIIDRTIFFVRRKTIYEYHRVNFDRQNWTVIYLNALPTCLDVKDCAGCLSRATSFQCHWCPGSNRCSNGMDRFRQEWLVKGCDRTSISNVAQCPHSGSHTNVLPSETIDAVNQSQAISDKHSLSQQDTDKSSMGVSGIIGILFITAFISGFAVWVFYAYRNPHTASGQFLIKYRPSTWGWRRGEARYTAATIHM